MKWRDAVILALERAATRHLDGVVTLAELKDRELANIVRDTGSAGKTPDRTLERVCQELRDEGVLEFLDDAGTYRISRSRMAVITPTR